MNNSFYKQYGASEAQNGVVVINTKNAAVFYGFAKDADDDETGYNWRKNYDHVPTITEIKSDIFALINALTDAKILSGYEWNSKPVYLSTENQFNFKAAYDLAVQTEGETLPLKLKLGEDADGNAVYHTFKSLTAFADFYTSAIAYIQTTLNDGWVEKDGIDWTAYELLEQ